MKSLGKISNQYHNGLFVIICDSAAKFGGWDEHGQWLVDQGSTELQLDGLRAYVEEGDGRYGGKPEVFSEDDGTLWLAPASELGVVSLTMQQIVAEPRTHSVEMGYVDVPSGILTLALAYPALNQEAIGDHKGLTHEPGERMDVAVKASLFQLTREFTSSGQIIALRPR